MIIGSISYKGKVIGNFAHYIDDGTVLYTINSRDYSLTFNGFDTMCEALGYDLKLL